MSRALSFVLFFGIFLLLVGGVHYYLWARLVRDLQPTPQLQRYLSIGVATLFVSIPVAMLTSRALPREIAQLTLKPSYIWIGVMWLLLVSVFSLDVVKLLVLGVERLIGMPHDAERRQTLARLFGFAAAALGGGTALFALVEGYRFHVKRVEVELERLPAELDGTTIVQLTDVHVGPSIGRRFIESIVKTVNDLKPDVVAITGDLVDGSVERLGQAVQPLENLNARFGSYFVTGNHEYYSGATQWCEHLPTLGLRVLRNERVSIGEGAATFDLAGIDDLQGGRFGNGHGPDLERALDGRNPERALVLLAHQPRAVHQANAQGVDLQLSGHTHGGQLWPFNWLVKLQQPVVSGLERVGATLLYVSNGTGYWGPPMRLAAPAEVTQIVLRSKKSSA
jgi:predicted MPP superfamily phosphohydrolase